MKVKFIGQSVKLYGSTKDPIEAISSAAMTSTQAPPKDKTGKRKLVKALVKKQHLSTLEFADADFELEVDRAIQQELTRHRHFSFLVESTRWCDYRKKPLRFVTKPVDYQPEEAVKLLEDLCELSSEVYDAMIQLGATRDYARKSLPLALASKMRMKGSFRTWFEMLPKRLDPTAHAEVRYVAGKVLDVLKDKCGEVFGEEEL